MANIIISGGRPADPIVVAVVSDVAPEETNVLWIDSGSSNLMKYYNQDTQTWTPISAAWG